MSLRGRAISGRGTASKRKVAAKSPISDFFGELPAPGTLNVALDRPIRFDPEKVAFPRDDSYYWAAEINGTRCLISRRKGHPLHIVEILSPYRLREKFQLKNGDSLEVRVPFSLIFDMSWKAKVIWNVFWKYRNGWYASRAYRMFIGPFWLVRRLATQLPQYHAKNLTILM